ncbi:MAG TPA: adenylate/guanylate cyclase domain-containing protein, partial [Spirochaetales bacterium]|nr:adenylate/guanylate cyclase domain-containing protein [Spirochaetales bacterium]
RIYEVLATVEQATKAQLALKKYFELGIKKYYSRDWDGALEIFTKLYDQTSDEPSAVFIDRIRLYKKNPPPQSWDGVFNIKVK